MLEGRIGTGAMGMVYRAHRADDGQLYAVKMLFGEVASDPAMRLRFAQEADAISHLSHPNVVSVVDFGRTQHDLHYLAMEYVHGETLASLIRREAPLHEARVIALSRQLCLGLAHAHRAGMVHRDFKPANVAVSITDDGREVLKVLDFGLVISERDGDLASERGKVVGTPIYIAPEQAQDREVDHRADLFALGVVMYEMLAGKPPFSGNATDIARANVQETPPSIATRNPAVTVSPGLEMLIFHLMAKQPAERPQTAEDVIRQLDLQYCAASSSLTRPGATPSVEPGREEAATWGPASDGRTTFAMASATCSRPSAQSSLVPVAGSLTLDSMETPCS